MQEFTLPFNQDHELIISTDTGAVKADGSIIASAGGTSVMATATFASEPIEGDFVPLRVDYIERFYAVQDIMGPRYTRREGKPSDEATLTARLIDRSIRPMLPNGLRHELHVVITVLSLGSIDPDSIAITAASIAIDRTGINWSGPVYGVKTGLDNNGQVLVNPDIDHTDNLLTASRDNKLVMVEFSGPETTENSITQLSIKALEQSFLIQKAHHDNQVAVEASDKLVAINQHSAEHTPDPEVAKLRTKLATGWREDGRSAGEIRPINIQIDLIPGVHGSARFKRGDTTVLSVTTLDTFDSNLLLESIEHRGPRYFFHHYNFMPFAGGEAGRIGSPSRRDIGHGYLAQNTLKTQLPNQADYPYTIRTVSEVLSSDGSSSMASASAGSLSQIVAGVPIKKLVGGISIGLAESDGDYVLLTDINAREDHYGLMDFKIAGTNDGITAMQLDVKNSGITLKQFSESLETAKSAREKVIDQMEKAIEGHEFSHPENAPLIVEVPRNHIGRLIGRGGANIREIEETTGAKISIERDRYAVIMGDTKAKQAVIRQIKAETREYEVGERFNATVREFLPYGAIVEIEAGREALLHVSELRDQYVEKTEDLLKVGDEVPVTIVETSSDGRIKVSIREHYPEFFKEKNYQKESSQC